MLLEGEVVDQVDLTDHWSGQIVSNAESGGANTGGGGGGTDPESDVAGNGGSGIVIIRYLGNPIATGGTVSQSGGNTIHTFTQIGTSSFAFQGGGSVPSGTATYTSVDEEVSIGTEVGKLTATDSDTTNLTYSLISGNGTNDQHNSLFTVSNLLS